jgi:hypothetical protein
MAGLAHIGAGFMAKRVVPSISIWIILLASEFIELLWIFFALIGLESLGNSPWSHSLFMSIIWSILFGIIMAINYKNYKNGIVLGIIVFSHWIIDFITHPMGAISGTPNMAADLPIFFGNTPKAGLGLYNHSMMLSIVIDVGITILGIALYISWIIRQKQNNNDSPQLNLTKSPRI